MKTLFKRNRLSSWSHHDQEWILEQYKHLIVSLYPVKDDTTVFQMVTKLTAKATFTKDNEYITRPLLWLSILGQNEVKSSCNSVEYFSEAIDDAVDILERWTTSVLNHLGEDERGLLESHIRSELTPGTETIEAVLNSLMRKDFSTHVTESLTSHIFIVCALLAAMWTRDECDISEITQSAVYARTIGMFNSH